jgi:branched-chain amino acid transport system permease protein
MNSRAFQAGLAVLVGILLAAIPFLVKAALPGSWELFAHILTKIFLNIAFGLCLWIMLQSGMLSLGQGAFISIGAYVTAILAAKYQFVTNVWLCYLIGGAVAAVLALLLGLITVHLRRIFFLLVTWAFGEMLSPVLNSFQEPFGAAAGIVGIPAPGAISLFPDAFTGYYYLALLFAAVVLLVIWSVSRSRIGLIYRSIGQNDTLTNFCGIHVRKYKLQLFALGCFLTGIGGGIMASYLTALSPDTFTFFTSLDIIMFNLIGGMGSIAGPILGAVVLTGANEFLFAIGYYKMIVYGLIITLSIRMLPGGLVSLPSAAAAAFERLVPKKEAGGVSPGSDA